MTCTRCGYGYRRCGSCNGLMCQCATENKMRQHYSEAGVPYQQSSDEWTRYARLVEYRREGRQLMMDIEAQRRRR